MIKFSKYQDWDPLKACLIGTSYLPELFVDITDIELRNSVELITNEIEQNANWLLGKLWLHEVEIFRTRYPVLPQWQKKYVAASYSPRNNLIVIADKAFYCPLIEFDFAEFYKNVADVSWPACNDYKNFEGLPDAIKEECKKIHGLQKHMEDFTSQWGCFNEVLPELENYVTVHEVDQATMTLLSSVTCAGAHRYFEAQESNAVWAQQQIDSIFTDSENHVITTSGRWKKSFAIPCPGLVLCFEPDLNLGKFFPDWEIVTVTDVPDAFADINSEYKRAIDFLDPAWSNLWPSMPVGLLSIDSKNIIVDVENDTVLTALHRHGVTAHMASYTNRALSNVFFGTVDLGRMS